MSYIYPMIIDKNSKTIHYTKEYNLGCDYKLNLKKLKKYHITDDSNFNIYYDKDDHNYILRIYLKRLETTKELAARVKKEENYMKNYNKQNKI